MHFECDASRTRDTSEILPHVSPLASFMMNHSQVVNSYECNSFRVTSSALENHAQCNAPMTSHLIDQRAALGTAPDVQSHGLILQLLDLCRTYLLRASPLRVRT